MSKFNLNRDINGFNAFGLRFAEVKFSVQLAVGVNQSFTVPGEFQKWEAIFSFEPGTSVWVANNETASVPTGTISATASELNPVAREVNAGDIVYMVTSNDTAMVGVTLYAIQ